MKKLFKILYQFSVDVLMLIITTIMFLGFIVGGKNVSGFLWILIGYIVYTIIRKYVLSKVLDEYILNYDLRKRLGLPDKLPCVRERSIPTFSLVIQALIFIGTIVMLLYMLLEFTGVL